MSRRTPSSRPPWIALGVLALAVALCSPAVLAQGSDDPSDPDAGDDLPVYTRTLDHGVWDAVLAAHVDERGHVDYRGLLDSPGDLQRLDDYLLWLQTADLYSTSPSERIAFWLNAYNAIALRALLDHYPVDSVMSVPGFFITDRQPVAGQALSLNEIENERLRHGLGDPRIHFGLTALCRSSPPLRREAYTGEALDRQLEAQARGYVEATTTVRPNVLQVELSQLFEWFARDFDGVGGVRTFVAQHLPDDVALHLRNETLVFVYTDWDWRLNDASTGSAASSDRPSRDPPRADPTSP